MKEDNNKNGLELEVKHVTMDYEVDEQGEIIRAVRLYEFYPVVVGVADAAEFEQCFNEHRLLVTVNKEGFDDAKKLVRK